MSSTLWSLDNPIFVQYLFYATILAVKMMVMSPLTSIQRRTKLVWINPEDAARRNVKTKSDDVEVERVRRAHRNDIENILPFWILGLFLIQLDPPSVVASVCFRVFTAARILHSFVYLKGMSVARGNFFAVGFFVNIFMALYILWKVSF